jgi:hypothetical protein
MLGGKTEAQVIEESEASKAAHAAAVEAARHKGLPENVVRMPETALERYRRALAIKNALEQAHPEDVRWLGSYETSSEYRAQQKMHQQFGEAYLSNE